MTCIGKDCDRKPHARGMCGPHYNMWRRTGSCDQPLGFRRKRGELTRMLREASTAETAECIKVTMPSRDRVVVTFQGRQMYAAKAVWIMAHGDPGAAWVLHTCGNGHAGCININHLYLGDCVQNARDMVVDDTSSRGVRNVHAKLTDAEVQQLRTFLLDGGSCKKGAAAYGVSLSAVTMMTSGNTWGWLPWPRKADGSEYPMKFKGQRLLAEGRNMGADTTGTEGA